MDNINSGSIRVTADSSVSAGVPFRIFSAVLESGATAGHLVLRNGTAATDAIWFNGAGTASGSHIFDFGGKGMLLEDGLFYDHEATNNTFAVINGRREAK